MHAKFDHDFDAKKVTKITPKWTKQINQKSFKNGTKKTFKK